MQEDTDKKMFKELLSDYAAPADDNGFSDFVLATLPRPQNHGRIKSFMVGGAGALGAAIAATQFKGLWGYISGIKMPKMPSLETSAVEISTLSNSSLMGSSYAPVLIGLGALLVSWMAHALLFGDHA